MNKKGFTLIELIVVMAILAILVLIAVPAFLGHTKDAEFTRLKNDARVLTDAAERYYMDTGDWPRLNDKAYTADEVLEKANGKVYSFDGKEAELDPEGKYYDIDYKKLSKYASIKSDVSNFVLQNPVGDVYIVGAKGKGTSSDAPLPSQPEPVVWGEIKNYGGSYADRFNSVTETTDGGFVAVGYSSSSDGDLSGNKGSDDAIIAKFDANGNKVWFKNYGGSKNDSFLSVTETTDGGYVAVGYSYSSNGDLSGNKGSDDAIIAKFDANGNKVWFKNYGGSFTDLFYSVTETTDGGYVAVGYSSSSDGDLSGSQGSYDAIIAKFDANGNKLWFKNYGGNKFDYFDSVTETTDGGYVAVGHSTSSNGLLSGNKGGDDAIIAKFNANGNILWFKNYGGSYDDRFNSVTETTDGGFVAVGESYSASGDRAGKSSDAIIAKFDANGNKVWFKNYGGSNSDRLQSVVETADGGFVAVGYSTSSNGDLPGNKGNEDAIIAKFDAEGNIN